MQRTNAVHLEDENREWSADRTGERNSAEINGGKARAVLRWEPEGQVEHHAGRETSFGGAQQKAQDVKADWGSHVKGDQRPAAHG
jgi:hypothetical protein